MSGQIAVVASEGASSSSPGSPAVSPRLVWPKKPLTIRIRQDLRAALDLVTEIKKARNRADGLDTTGIDFTGTLEEAVEDFVKGELAHYGLDESDFCRGDEKEEREKHARAVVDRIVHLIEAEAKEAKK